MNLRDIVQKYRSLTGGFGQPVPLAAFGFTHQETARIFGVFDEDYHISRFFHFTLEESGANAASYNVNGFAQSHVSLDAEIETIL